MASLRKRGRFWYYRVMQPDGSRPEVKGSTDKRVTEQLAAKAETDAARARAGIVDHFEAHRNRPIGEHVDEYLAFLRSKDGTTKHVDLTETRIRAVIAGCGFRRLEDLDGPAVAEWLMLRRKAKTTKDDKSAGMSAQTSNHYRTAVRGFAAWLVRHRRMAVNPLSSLAALNAKLDARHDRGVLSADEWAKLLEATRTAKPFRGLTGDDRVMLFIAASYTGLRSSELASLTPRVSISPV